MSTSTGGRRHDTLDLKRLSYGLLAAYNTWWVFFAVSRRYVFIQHKMFFFYKRGIHMYLFSCERWLTAWVGESIQRRQRGKKIRG